VVDDYRATMDRILAAIRGEHDVVARQLLAALQDARNRSGPNQRRGVVSKADLREMGGDEAVRRFEALLRAARRTPTSPAPT
jgi:hypothetical protein